MYYGVEDREYKNIKLTVSNIHWFSMMAPQQPKNPTTSTMAPAAIHSAVAERKPKLGASDA